MQKQVVVIPEFPSALKLLSEPAKLATLAAYAAEIKRYAKQNSIKAYIDLSELKAKEALEIKKIFLLRGVPVLLRGKEDIAELAADNIEVIAKNLLEKCLTDPDKIESALQEELQKLENSVETVKVSFPIPTAIVVDMPKLVHNLTFVELRRLIEDLRLSNLPVYFLFEEKNDEAYKALVEFGLHRSAVTFSKAYQVFLTADRQILSPLVFVYIGYDNKEKKRVVELMVDEDTIQLLPSQ